MTGALSEVSAQRSGVPHLLARYAASIRGASGPSLDDPRTLDDLLMERVVVGGNSVEMFYAPFDHVNPHARLVIVGMTPGRFQAAAALKVARLELDAGRSIAGAAEAAKVSASFSGEPMRGNLVRMLDLIGIPRLLDIPTAALLWAGRSELVHFTSALRYPVFVDGGNWSGQPDMVRTPRLRALLEMYTGVELDALRGAVVVPLGPKVSAAMRHLAGIGMLDLGYVLDGLPHPSGANAERIACFLGTKPAHLCSAKTNAAAISKTRDDLTRQVDRLSNDDGQYRLDR